MASTTGGPSVHGDNSSSGKISIEDRPEPPMSPRSWKQPDKPISRKHTQHSVDLDDYFSGPRAIDKHSKWPFFLRMHGSVMPKMILPLFTVGAWATCITCISEFKHSLGISNLLLTVLGFVVGMAISFRTSTAYERYAEGRKYWAQLILTAQNMSRVIWVQAKEREGELGKQDLLNKLTGLNLIVAFAIALKHRVRFEPGIEFDDLAGLVSYMDTFAKAASSDIEKPKRKNGLRAVGENLGVSFAESNPRKYIKRAKKPLGNLPLEILKYLTSYVDEIIGNGTLSVPIYQTHAVNNIATLNEVLVGCDRVLNTPLPIAYSIAISQITWVYVMILPFQLYTSLRWVTIPGSIVAAYIILGIAAIGREIENPFGNDVNDLPLDAFCDSLQEDIDIMTATPAPAPADFLTSIENLVLFPLSLKGHGTWKNRTKAEIREALMTKSNANLENRRSFVERRKSEAVEKVETKEQQHTHHEAV